MIDQIYAMKLENGNYLLLYKSDGALVTKFDSNDPLIYPENVVRSCYYDSPDGFELSFKNVNKLKLEIE